jgi:hypothetical protein
MIINTAKAVSDDRVFMENDCALHVVTVREAGVYWEIADSMS